MMLLANGCTARLTRYFLTQKNAMTTLTALTSYHFELECQTGFKLQTVCIDTSHEWLNEKWEEYCSAQGIVLRFVIPYTHSQNGFIEKAI